MDTTETAPLLSLDTLIIRPMIEIDKISYEIVSPDELSIVDSHRFGVWGRRIAALATSDIEEDDEQLTAMVDKLARKVAVGVPADIFEKLSGAHRMAIVDVFTGLLLHNRLQVAGAIAKAANGGQTGEKQSPGSNASTAAARDGGFTKRLLRWFGLI